MFFEDLATELVITIFFSCKTIQDTINLAATCSRFQRLYSSSRKLDILKNSAESQFGPLQDAFQLVTHNASQPAHILRQVPLSLALLKQVFQVGRIACRWEELYPFKKWKHNFEDRRLLTESERHNFRRALYRLWLYSRAFHNPSHTRYNRLSRSIVLERAELLRNWNNAELAEIADVRHILREVLSSSVCPSNGTIRRKHQKLFLDENHQLMFNMHFNCIPQYLSEFAIHQLHHTDHNLTFQRDRHHAKYCPTPTHEPGFEGWGDDIAHYYVMEDMLKLDPAQILWLKDNATSKSQVQVYISELGEWFDNNGETFGQTLEYVLMDRGADVEEFMDAVQDRVFGISTIAL